MHLATGDNRARDAVLEEKRARNRAGGSLSGRLNCERLTTDPAGPGRRMADLLDLDPERLIAWLFARCVMESPEWPELRQVAARLAP